MAAHARFSIQTGVPVYFCDPRSPWQRGSNENTNGLLRQYFPKRTEIAHYSQADLDHVAAELNGRPRQTGASRLSGVGLPRPGFRQRELPRNRASVTASRGAFWARVLLGCASPRRVPNGSYGRSRPRPGLLKPPPYLVRAFCMRSSFTMKQTTAPGRAITSTRAVTRGAVASTPGFPRESGFMRQAERRSNSSLLSSGRSSVAGPF
jgi:hypothetical protein